MTNVLVNSWDIEAFYKDNPRAYSNEGILAYHIGVLCNLMADETTNLLGLTYRRDAEGNYFCEEYWVGNVWGAIAQYAANFSKSFLIAA
jgi:hypothetical protein